MKLLITGGTGFCGCHVARRFLEEGWTVRLFDMLPLDEPDLKSEVPSGRVEVVGGDVRDAEALAAAAEGVDAIVHTAAALPIQGSRDTIMDTNVGGTRNMLNAGAWEFLLIRSS